MPRSNAALLARTAREYAVFFVADISGYRKFIFSNEQEITIIDKSNWVYVDFNGFLDENVLCLSHDDTCEDRDGNRVTLREGMQLTAFDGDLGDDGSDDDLFASGSVAPTPPELKCTGSRWVLLIDSHGLRHESDLADDT